MSELPTADQLLAHYHARCDASRGISCPLCSAVDRTKAKAVRVPTDAEAVRRRSRI